MGSLINNELIYISDGLGDLRRERYEWQDGCVIVTSHTESTFTTCKRRYAMLVANRVAHRAAASPLAMAGVVEPPSSAHRVAASLRAM